MINGLDIQTFLAWELASSFEKDQAIAASVPFPPRISAPD